MLSKVAPYLIGAIAATAGIYGVHTMAASGDVKYETTVIRQCITAAQASCYADCAIADGTWDGAKTELTRVQAKRFPDCSPGRNFAAYARGNKTAPLGSVPNGAIHRGVVP